MRIRRNTKLGQMNSYDIFKKWKRGSESEKKYCCCCYSCTFHTRDGVHFFVTELQLSDCSHHLDHNWQSFFWFPNTPAVELIWSLCIQSEHSFTRNTDGFIVPSLLTFLSFPSRFSCVIFGCNLSVTFCFVLLELEFPRCMYSEWTDVFNSDLSHCSCGGLLAVFF